jgi:hypothetical protein
MNNANGEKVTNLKVTVKMASSAVVNRFLCVAFFFREREVKHVVAPKTVWFLD